MRAILQKKTRGDLKAGLEGYTGKRCDELSTLFGSKKMERTTKQDSAQNSYCNYYAKAKSGCEAYLQRHANAAAARTTVKNRAQKDSADPKAAWVAATKIGCLVDTFTDNDAENVTIDAAAAKACSAISCDADCIKALDLTESLSRVAPAATMYNT